MNITKPVKLTKHTVLLLAVTGLILLFQSVIYAKPNQIEYSRELDALTRALESIHPNPWRKQLKQAFRDQLTKDPNILNRYPLAPWLTISSALKSLDRQQHDSVTGINLLKQERVWKRLPVTFALFADGFYIIDAEEPFLPYVGKKLLTINEQNVTSLYNRLANYFPEHDKDWLAEYLKITELLSFLGARCVDSCQLTISGSLGIETLAFKEIDLLTDLDSQHNTTQLFITEHFRNTVSNNKVLEMLDKRSLYWNLADPMLQSTVLYNEQEATALKYLNNQLLDNIVLDLRLISKVDPALIERISTLIRKIPQESPHRVIYAIIDRSTQPVVYELVGRLSEIPEVSFVGQSMALELSHFYDAKPLKLGKTELNIDIATRFKKYLTAFPDQQMIRPYQISWNSDDYFEGEDTLINAIVDLIEINQP